MAGDLELKVYFATPGAHTDMRTFTIKQVNEDSTEVDLYKFSHPVTGSITGVTTYHRKNFATGRWESAGHIDWSSVYACSVWWGGVNKESAHELRKRKKTTSQSRRFKTPSGAEYKWKVAENDEDLVCVSAQLSTFGKTVAEWSQEKQTLHVAEAVVPILDRVVLTWILNLWMKIKGFW